MGWHLPYRPLDTALKFQVSVQTESTFNGDNSGANIRYGLQLRPAPKQGWGDYCLEVQQTDTRYHTGKINPADDVILRLAAPWKKLELLLDKNGNPYNIRNHVEIWQLWNEDVRIAVQATYKGQWVDEMVRKTDDLILHPDQLLKTILTKDQVLANYFNDVYKRVFDFRTQHSAPATSMQHVMGENFVPLQEVWQYRKTPAGGHVDAEGFLPETADMTSVKSVKEWLQRKTGTVITEQLEVKRAANYEISQQTGWYNAFNTISIMRLGNVWQKRTTIQLSPEKMNSNGR
ncbi:hypothetical protein [Taibaiella soli]|uniref:Uncharacterized protein n=1 Tax=Taibaiella soli TaxID=1649169 RepID=A0A2W2BJG9_9BACT|nr:hypothetical protein [Taibaiella soli]PZF73586.1 hypothetical protein DN068_07640 [Taibaiella soli]